MVNSKTMQFIILAIIVIGGIAAYAGATNTISLNDGNSTVNDNATNVTGNDSESPVSVDAIPGESLVQTPVNGTVINNNNYININNNIQVPTSIQPSITPSSAATDNTLTKTTTVKEKTVTAPKVVQQKTVIIKTSDLYTGQIVKLTDTQTVKKGLEITEVNTGKTGCEYVVIKNNNDFDMGMGGYTLWIEETETGVRLPNLEIAAGKSVKMFTINGKPDTFDKNGDLVKFHFRLAKELYPNNTPITVYLLEPNFNEALSEYTTKA